MEVIHKPTGQTIGMGILSWHGATSLKNALSSYDDADLFSLFDDVLLFLPDPDEDVISVAKGFDLHFETHPDNCGIMGGMEEIAQRLTTDYILFVENDNPLVEPRSVAAKQISQCLSLLAKDAAIMARLRHREHYGDKGETIDKYRRYYPDKDSLTSKLRRLFRPGKARRLSGKSVYAGTGHAERFATDITPAGDGIYLVGTRALPWSNQSILIKRSVFLDVILPYANSVPMKRGVNGFKTLENELNRSKFWTRSGWKVACAPGLFTHRRIADPAPQ